VAFVVWRLAGDAHGFEPATAGFGTTRWATVLGTARET
jgi:hypothetical protein